MSGTYGINRPWRFWLRDIEGIFPDLQFEVNPGDYTPHNVDSSRYGFHKGMTGRRRRIRFNKIPETRKLQWDSIHQTMFKELRNRYLSGNTFWLFDHNRSQIVGIISLFELEEIKATVPSRYTGSITIKAIGEED